MPFLAARVPALSAVAFTIALQQRDHTDSFYRRMIFRGPGREISALLAASVSCGYLLDCLGTRDFCLCHFDMWGEPLCGSESPASVTVDDSVTSSASGTRTHLPVVSDGSEGSSVVVKRFRKRSLPELDPTADSLLLERAASRPSEVAISDSSSGFVFIGPHETFLLPSPKFAVRPRSVLLQDSSGPVFRRELAPNRGGLSRPASVRPRRSPPSCNPLPPPFFALRGLFE